MEKDTKKEFDNLAIIINTGFEEARKDRNERFAKVDERFAKVDERFAKVDERFMEVNARLGLIEKDIKTLVTKEEFDDLFYRVSYIEQKLGIESGKA